VVDICAHTDVHAYTYLSRASAVDKLSGGDVVCVCADDTAVTDVVAGVAGVDDAVGALAIVFDVTALALGDTAAAFAAAVAGVVATFDTDATGTFVAVDTDTGLLLVLLLTFTTDTLSAATTAAS
jgi:hypothetical protein